jgi:hypothetical protein
MFIIFFIISIYNYFFFFFCKFQIFFFYISVVALILLNCFVLFSSVSICVVSLSLLAQEKENRDILKHMYFNVKNENAITLEYFNWRTNAV